MTAIVEAAELAQESSQTLIDAQAFKIATTGQYTEAGERLKAIMALKKKIAETFDPHIKRAFEAHRSLVAEKKTHETPLQTAEALLKRSMVTFQLQEETRRRAEQAKLEEAARKEREKLEEQAAKAAEKGKVERAEALQAKASAVVAPIVGPSTPKVSGISTRTTFRAEVADKMELVKAVAAGKVPLLALEPNITFLNQQARSLKETLDYPGVKVVQETGIASRTA